MKASDKVNIISGVMIFLSFVMNALLFFEKSFCFGLFSIVFFIVFIVLIYVNIDLKNREGQDGISQIQ